MKNMQEMTENDKNDKKDEQSQNKDNYAYKKITAELHGDLAIQADLLETALQISKKTRIKTKKDEMLVSAALLSLEYAIDQCRQATGKRFPNNEDLIEFLAKNT
jgi:hypothetical protein